MDMLPPDFEQQLQDAMNEKPTIEEAIEPDTFDYASWAGPYRDALQALGRLDQSSTSSSDTMSASNELSLDSTNSDTAS